MYSELNIISSDESTLITERLQRRAASFTCSISAFVFIIFGAYNIYLKDQTVGYIELFVGAVLFFNLYLLHYKNLVLLNGRITMFFIMLMGFTVIHFGGIAHTGNLWLSFIPMLTMMLLPYKEGIKWMIVFLVAMSTYLIAGMFQLIILPFEPIELRQTLIVFFIFNFLVYFNERFKKEMREKVQQKESQLYAKDQLIAKQSKNAQMGEMLSMIAHQWRQPLNAISAAAIGLSMKQQLGELKDTDILEASSFIQKQSQDMSTIINDFMNFFKSDSTKSLFQLSNVIKSIEKIVSPQLKNREISCTKQLEDDIKIYGNEKELVHILLNLIINARDVLMQKTQNKRRISIRANKKNQNIEIKVSDNGVGIDKEILDRVFDPYFTTKEQGKGTGIGLYMTKKMVENDFQGDIYIESVPNKGTTITLSLPSEPSCPLKQL